VSRAFWDAIFTGTLGNGLLTVGMRPSHELTTKQKCLAQLAQRLVIERANEGGTLDLLLLSSSTSRVFAGDAFVRFTERLRARSAKGNYEKKNHGFENV